jgi:hypothetical protein
MSLIDPTKPADGAPASKAELRANLGAISGEIEALRRGFLGETVSVSRDLRSSDTVLLVDSAEAVTLVVPAATFPLGSTVTLMRRSTPPVTIEAAPGVTLLKPSDRKGNLRVQNSIVGLWQCEPDVWLLYGDLAW